MIRSKDLWGDSRDFVIGETMLESGFIILSKRLYSYFWNYMCMPKFSLLYSIVFEKVNTCVEFVQLEEQACGGVSLSYL